MKRSILLILILFLCACLQAAKKPSLKTRIKEGYAAIKAESGQEKAEKVLLDSLVNGKTVIDNRQRAEAWYVCALLEQSQNDALNQQAYLKQKLDTLKLYNTILNIYRYVLKCDSFDSGKKYTQHGRAMMKLGRKNLLGGGKYLLKAEKWQDAWKYLDMYLQTCSDEPDSVIGRVAYWATVASVKLSNDRQILKYVDLAIGKGAEKDRINLAEYRARAYRGTGDSISWKECLEEGVRLYPAHEYFFLKLIDYYIHHDKLRRAEVLTDSLLDADSQKPVFWLAKSLIALDQKNYESCVELSNNCLALDRDNADALYNKGISYLNMALAENSAKKRITLYKEALEPMEHLRTLQPDALNRWGKQLYRIYFNLNMGKKFDEIDNLLKHSDAS